MTVPGIDAGASSQQATTHRADPSVHQQQQGNNNTVRRSSSNFSRTSWHTVGSGFRETLCQAVAENDEETVRHLLQYGANVETPGDAGKKPLLIAAEKGLAGMMELLLSNGASVESQTDLNQPTALTRACEEGHEAAVHLLVESGANVEARRRDGYTPLFIAVTSANEGLAKYLLQHGADKTSRLADGRNLEDFAQGNDSLLALLREDHLLQGPEIGPKPRSSKLQFKFVRPPEEPKDTTQLSATQSMQATIVNFFIGRREQRSQPISVSVHDLLYGKGPDGVSKTYTANARSSPTFTWYHIPANNVSVCTSTKFPTSSCGQLTCK